MKFFLKKIKEKGLLTYVDVGAMGGIPRRWAKVKDGLKIIGFEPDAREFSKLRDSENEQFFDVVLYRGSQSLDLYVAKDPGKTSIYKPDFKTLDGFADVQRHHIIDIVRVHSHLVDCLDHVLKQKNLDADFLKIDTQGSELDILKGGEHSLGNIFGVELEVEFISLYENQPLFADVHFFMTQKGFVLYDLRRAFWKRKEYFDYVGKGQLVFADAVYVREINSFLAALDKIEDKLQRVRKIYCAVLVCLVYGIYDYAVVVTDNVFQCGHIDSDERREIIAAIKRISKAGVLPSFWGRGLLYKVFNKLAEVLKPKSYLGWADGDKVIGNVKSA